MSSSTDPRFAAGLELLGRPISPLARIVQMLYLTGPFDRVAEVIDELREPIETHHATYPEPAALLRPHLDILETFERLKHPRPPLARIIDEDGSPLDAMEALALYVEQQLLTAELERINSLLCTPCGCTLCCIGPGDEQRQKFFEIPLAGHEIERFPLPRVESDASRAGSPHDEPPLSRDGHPFYRSPAALYHWQEGWSLILPRHAACPHLKPASGHCAIYPERPDVCRRPQIFAYALERSPAEDLTVEGRAVPGYRARRKLLAVWDCPYVQRLQAAIGAYGEACGLEPVFRENKG